MAASQSKVNRSDEIRAVFNENPKISPAEVVETLDSRGIKVNIALVYKVKREMKTGQRKRAQASTREVGAPSKSAEIRAVLSRTPSASAKKVVDILAKKGVEVTEGLVYQVRNSMKKAASTQGDAAAPAMATNGQGSSGASGDPVKLVLKVKGLADAVGGIKSLQQLVDAMVK